MQGDCASRRELAAIRDFHTDIDQLAVAEDFQRHPLASLHQTDEVYQMRVVVNGNSVEFYDHVARTNAGGLGRSTAMKRLMGIEKPMPSKPPELLAMAVLMPIISPRTLHRGPPLLPGLIA